MSEHETQGDRQLVLPQLRYEAPLEAIAWLCRVFGFVERTRMSGPAGELYIADLVAPGGGAVLVCGPFSAQAKAQLRGAVPQFHESTERAWPNLSYSITVLVPDVNGHHEHARAEGAQILVAPRDQPWGLRDYEVLDLEGRQWNFSQHLRDADPGDWGADSID